MALAPLLPMTCAGERLGALGMVARIHGGSVHGGAIPALLSRIAGRPTFTAMPFDGVSMAEQGETSYGLGVAGSSSAIGGTASARVPRTIGPIPAPDPRPSGFT
jgi:TctA family transporter